jgi:hypothetical protein
MKVKVQNMKVRMQNRVLILALHQEAMPIGLYRLLLILHHGTWSPNVIVAQLLEKFPTFYVTLGLLPCSREFYLFIYLFISITFH